MTTKDWIYLGFIALTALAFYCNGFYAGVLRCRKAYDGLLRDFESENEAKILNTSVKEVGETDRLVHLTGPSRQIRPGISGYRLPGGFQNN